MSIIIVIIIAVSLSMDAFSLSLAYGTLNLKNKDMRILAITVGIFHFIMPLLGALIGDTILYFVPIGSNILIFTIFLFIGIEMILETFKKKDQIVIMGMLEILMFSFAVSIDSFSIGIGLNSVNHHHTFCATIFAVSSMLFTFMGLHLGKKINEFIGKISTLIGGLVLIIIGLFYLF